MINGGCTIVWWERNGKNIEQWNMFHGWVRLSDGVVESSCCDGWPCHFMWDAMWPFKDCFVSQACCYSHDCCVSSFWTLFIQPTFESSKCCSIINNYISSCTFMFCRCICRFFYMHSSIHLYHIYIYNIIYIYIFGYTYIIWYIYIYTHINIHKSHMYIYIYIHILKYLNYYIHVYSCYLYVYVYVNVILLSYSYTHIYMYIFCMYVYIYILLYSYIHILSYIYIYMHSKKEKQTHIFLQTLSKKCGFRFWQAARCRTRATRFQWSMWPESTGADATGGWTDGRRLQGWWPEREKGSEMLGTLWCYVYNSFAVFIVFFGDNSRRCYKRIPSSRHSFFPGKVLHWYGKYGTKHVFHPLSRAVGWCKMSSPFRGNQGLKTGVSLNVRVLVIMMKYHYHTCLL